MTSGFTACSLNSTEKSSVLKGRGIAFQTFVPSLVPGGRPDHVLRPQLDIGVGSCEVLYAYNSPSNGSSSESSSSRRFCWASSCLLSSRCAAISALCLGVGCLQSPRTLANPGLVPLVVEPLTLPAWEEGFRRVRGCWYSSAQVVLALLAAVVSETFVEPEEIEAERCPYARFAGFCMSL